MASLNMFVSPIITPQRRVVRVAATSAKSSGGGSEEKGIFDFIIGGLVKEDQIIYETDPILKKVEGKSGTTTKSSVAPPPPPKKEGGFNLGGFFAKK